MLIKNVSKEYIHIKHLSPSFLSELHPNKKHPNPLKPHLSILLFSCGLYRLFKAFPWCSKLVCSYIAISVFFSSKFSKNVSNFEHQKYFWRENRQTRLAQHFEISSPFVMLLNKILTNVAQNSSPRIYPLPVLAPSHPRRGSVCGLSLSPLYPFRHHHSSHKYKNSDHNAWITLETTQIIVML